MTFEQMIAVSDVVLTEGGMVEVIRRAPDVEIDPFIAHSGLIYQEKGREVLTRIYKGYIDIGRAHDLPFISLAPTWRANPERLEKSVFRNHKNINHECVEFLKNIRAGYGDYAPSIYVGGVMACRGDAYKPEEALSREDAASFHRRQAGELAQSGVDLIKAATLPALSEAYGMASAIASHGIPYVLSFVIRPDGTLLDGTPIARAIEIIDTEIEPKPVFYMVNCVHPSVFARAMGNNNPQVQKVTRRLWGFQANTSAKSPEELNDLPYLDTTAPAEFADHMIALRRTYGLKVLGGCCGSDDRHIIEIAKRLQQEKNGE